MYCSTIIILDITQAFDRIWFAGLHLLRSIHSSWYFLFFESHLENRYFVIRVGNDISPIHRIESGVPQGAISSPLLFNIYTNQSANFA